MNGKIDGYAGNEDDAQVRLRYNTEQSLLTAQHELGVVQLRAASPDALVTLSAGDRKTLASAERVLNRAIGKLSD